MRALSLSFGGRVHCQPIGTISFPDSVQLRQITLTEAKSGSSGQVCTTQTSDLIRRMHTCDILMTTIRLSCSFFHPSVRFFRYVSTTVCVYLYFAGLLLNASDVSRTVLPVCASANQKSLARSTIWLGWDRRKRKRELAQTTFVL